MEYFKKAVDYCASIASKKISVHVWVFVVLMVLYLLPRPF